MRKNTNLYMLYNTAILIKLSTFEGLNCNNYKSLTSCLNEVLSHMIKWFAANNLVLTLDQMNTVKLKTKNSSHSTLCTGYKEKYIEDSVNTKFFGLPIDNHINWKNHTEQMIPELSGECYAIRLMVHICNINTESNLVCILSFYYKIWNIFGGVTLPTVGIFSFYKRKTSEIWLVNNPEPHVEIYLNN